MKPFYLFIGKGKNRDCGLVILIFILFLDVLLIGLLSLCFTSGYTIEAIDAQDQPFPESIPFSEFEGGPRLLTAVI
jgi:hypothetical protein